MSSESAPYLRYVLFLVILTIAAIAVLSITFWHTGRTEHVNVISIVATLIMASIGILIVVISLDLNARTLRQNESLIRQNERLIRVTEFAGNPHFDRDSFKYSGTFENITFSVANTGGKPAFISKMYVKVRGKRFLDATIALSEDEAAVEAGGVFSYTLNIGQLSGDTMTVNDYDPSVKNDELVLISVEYRNLQHRGIEGMRDVILTEYFTRDLNAFIPPRK